MWAGHITMRCSSQVLEAGGTSGFLHTLFNSINVMCGVGLLATPYTAAEMGWSSLLLLCALGAALLQSCLHRAQHSADVRLHGGGRAIAKASRAELHMHV